MGRGEREHERARARICGYVRQHVCNSVCVSVCVCVCVAYIHQLGDAECSVRLLKGQDSEVFLQVSRIAQTAGLGFRV